MLLYDKKYNITYGRHSRLCIFMFDLKGLIMIIDCHTHIFPTKVAQKAAHDLMHLYGSPPVVEVTASALLGHMNQCGVDRSVILITIGWL